MGNSNDDTINENNYYLIIYESKEIKIYSNNKIDSEKKLKSLIQKQLNIHPYFQAIKGVFDLKHGNHEKLIFPLEYHTEIKLKNEHTIKCRTQFGVKFEITLSQNDSIIDIKKKISDKTRVDTDRLLLSYMNKFLNDKYSLFIDYISKNSSKYNKDKDEIYICFERGPDIYISFFYKGNEKEISINDFDTVNQLYYKIQQRLNIYKKKHLLRNSHGNFLEESNFSVINYLDFLSDNLLEYVNLKFCIYIRQLSGKCIIIYCDPYDTILTIKEIFYYREGLEVSQNRLIFAGRDLENTRTLSDYNISHGSTLHSVERLRG